MATKNSGFLAPMRRVTRVFLFVYFVLLNNFTHQLSALARKPHLAGCQTT